MVQEYNISLIHLFSLNYVEVEEGEPINTGVMCQTERQSNNPKGYQKRVRFMCKGRQGRPTYNGIGYQECKCQGTHMHSPRPNVNASKPWS